MKKYIILVFTACFLFACEKGPAGIPVSSISLDRQSVDMLIGESISLSAIVLPADATDKSIKWNSSNTSVAKVSNSGVINAIGEGSSTITASAGGQSASCLVTVREKRIEVTSVSLDKAFLTLGTGQTSTLVATVMPLNATDNKVSWHSSNNSVASVDERGKITALVKGETTITAKAGNQSASCNVSVYTAVQGLALDKAELKLLVGNTYQLHFSLSPSDAEIQGPATWNSSESAVATVTDDGLINAVAEGMTLITLSIDGKTATCKVTCESASGGIEDMGSENWK